MSTHALAISMSLLRHTMSLMILLRCLQDSLSSPEVDELMYFSITLINSSFENKFHVIISLQGISSSNWGSIWQSWAKLNDRWRACHKSLISIQGLPLKWITSIAGILYYLTQFMSSQGPLLLFVISWIFKSKKLHFVFLTVFLNFFQSSICLNCQ